MQQGQRRKTSSKIAATKNNRFDNVVFDNGRSESFGTLSAQPQHEPSVASALEKRLKHVNESHSSSLRNGVEPRMNVVVIDGAAHDPVDSLEDNAETEINDSDEYSALRKTKSFEERACAIFGARDKNDINDLNLDHRANFYDDGHEQVDGVYKEREEEMVALEPEGAVNVAIGGPRAQQQQHLEHVEGGQRCWNGSAVTDSAAPARTNRGAGYKQKFITKPVDVGRIIKAQDAIPQKRRTPCISPGGQSRRSSSSSSKDSHPCSLAFAPESLLFCLKLSGFGCTGMNTWSICTSRMLAFLLLTRHALKSLGMFPKVGQRIRLSTYAGKITTSLKESTSCFTSAKTTSGVHLDRSSSFAVQSDSLFDLLLCAAWLKSTAFARVV